MRHALRVVVLALLLAVPAGAAPVEFTYNAPVDGDNFGVYEKAVRHRLQVNVRRASDTRTTVSIERSVFKRERILFVDKDEPLQDPRTEVQKSILDAIGKSL